MKHRRTRLAAAALALGIAAGVPLATTGTASAKSCKWYLVSYDAATHTSTYACSSTRP